MIYVLYDNDPDGFGSAFAAWLKYGETAKYLPVKRGDPIPAVPDATQVFIVDFSYPREALVSFHDHLVKNSASLLLLDHHKSAQQELGDLPYCSFDLSVSAAVLCWRYFHPAQSVPQFYGYIQDADLYTWTLPFSREVHKAVESWPLDFETWERISGIDVPDRDFIGEAHCIESLISDGEICARYCAELRKRLLETEHRLTLKIGAEEYSIPVVNSPIEQSELCEMMLEKNPDSQMSACYWDIESGVQCWSLRSREGFDASRVAQAFGGGGHAQAAGFRLKFDGGARLTAIEPEKDKAQ